MAASSGQLEREAEQTRMRMEATLAELRDRLTPGQVLDEVLGYAADGAAGQFVTNLKAQALSRPLALGLVGVGLAWLMLPASSGARSRNGSAGVPERAKDVAAGVVDGTTEAAGRAGGAAQSAFARGSGALKGSAAAAADAASRVSGKTAEAAAAGYDTVARSAADTARRVSEGASGFGRSVTDIGASASDRAIAFCREQPLVVTAAGVAAGVVVGALLLRGKQPDRLRREASERLENAASAAREAFGNTWQAVGDSVAGARAGDETGKKNEDAGPQRPGETIGIVADSPSAPSVASHGTAVPAEAAPTSIVPAQDEESPEPGLESRTPSRSTHEHA